MGGYAVLGAGLWLAAMGAWGVATFRRLGDCGVRTTGVALRKRVRGGKGLRYLVLCHYSSPRGGVLVVEKAVSASVYRSLTEVEALRIVYADKSPRQWVAEDDLPKLTLRAAALCGLGVVIGLLGIPLLTG